MTVAFLLTAYNESPVSLDASVASAAAQSRGGPLTVVDDSSAAPVRVERPGSRVLRLAENHGIAAARNAGLAEMSDADFVAIFNCDILLAPTWAQVTVEHLERNPGTGAVWTPLAHARDDMAARWWLDCQEEEATLVRPPETWAPGHAVMFRRAALDRVEGYDAVNFRNISEDADICLRMRDAGFVTDLLLQPVNHSLQDVSLSEMARKEIARHTTPGMSRSRQGYLLIRKASRRSLRHAWQRKWRFIPRNWAVAALGVIRVARRS